MTKTHFTGELGNLSPAQEKTFAAFKEHVKKKTTNPRFDDYYLLRFCRARDFHFENVKKMFDDHVEWLKHNDVENIESFKAKNYDEIRKLYPHGYYFTDKQGRPVYIERIGIVNIKKMFEVIDEENLLRFFIQSYEKLQRIVLPACSKIAGKKIERTMTVLDLKGLSITKVGKSIYDLMKKTSKIAQDNYPETLGTMLVVNAPLLFSGLWTIIKAFLDEKTKLKIHIIGSGYFKTLSEFIDPSQIPEFLGGKCKVPLEDNPGPWKSEWDQYGKPKQEKEVIHIKPVEKIAPIVDLSFWDGEEEALGEEESIQININYLLPPSKEDELFKTSTYAQKIIASDSHQN